MPDLQFKVISVSAACQSASLEFELHINNCVPHERVENLSLNVQLYIHPGRRRYSNQERDELRHLFGEPRYWDVTLRPLFWADTTVDVPFNYSSSIDWRVLLSAGSDDAALAYCGALCDGDISANLLFSGTIFYRSAGPVQVAFLPWSKETACRIPYSVWKQLLDANTPQLRSANCTDKRQTWPAILEHAVEAAGRRKL